MYKLGNYIGQTFLPTLLCLEILYLARFNSQFTLMTPRAIHHDFRHCFRTLFDSASAFSVQAPFSSHHPSLTNPTFETLLELRLNIIQCRTLQNDEYLFTRLNKISDNLSTQWTNKFSIINEKLNLTSQHFYSRLGSMVKKKSWRNCVNFIILILIILNFF